MNKEFVTYEQALALKELGFDEDTYGYTIRQDRLPKIPLPLKQQVFRWFREKRNLIGLIEYSYAEGKDEFDYVIWQESYFDWTNDIYDTYEEAENACIDKLIEIAKQQAIS
jgi:hypothetical protein